MQTQNRICPQCGQLLIPNEMYCRNCRAYYPEAANNTNTGFPTATDHLNPSGQNWNSPGIRQDTIPPGEKIGVPTNPQLPPKQFRIRPIPIVLVILLIVFLVGGAYMLGRSSNTASPTNVNTFPSSSATLPSPTNVATPTPISPVPTTPTVGTGANLLYTANFSKGWTMVGFKVNSDNSIVCNGSAQASAVTSFVAPQDYTVQMTVQYLGNPGSFFVHARINDQHPEGVSFSYDGSSIRNSSNYFIADATIDPHASFTVKITYKEGNSTIVIGQAGTNNVGTNTTSVLGSGVTSITADAGTSIQILNFQIYSA